MTGGEPVDRRAFRDLMGRWATGVSVVTAAADGADAGLTVNSLVSVSLDPPSVLIGLMSDVDTLPVLERSRSFAVSVLAADQRAVSERFARPVPPAEKFRGLSVRRGTTGAALIEGALAWIECRVTSVVPMHDHRMVLGEVVRVETGRDGPPLVFWRSGYAEAEPDGRLRLPPPRTPPRP
jgi:3-hydroxy-9,10-secoandrosta-1,3,5(10)-triene-9,17-dione monooxygenase reductase component